MRYYILQLKGDKHGLLFRNMRELQDMGVSLNISYYNLVYCGTDPDGSIELEGIYHRFNMAHPADYYGHSLSVSDVVVMESEQSFTAYFVDSFGFQELPDFFQEDTEINIDYILKSDFGYLHIQTVDDGLDYTKYDLQCVELDGGVYDDTEVPYLVALYKVLNLEFSPLREFGVLHASMVDKVREQIDLVSENQIAAKKAHDFLYEKSNVLFNPIGGYDIGKLECFLGEYATGIVESCGLPITVLEVALSGKRSRGKEKDSSDLDVIVFYTGDFKEDRFFNILNNEPYCISGVRVDFNPVRYEETGDFYEYACRVDEYLCTV